MRTLAIALESVGIIAIILGLVFESLTGADLGYIFISGGAVIIAGGGMVWAKLNGINQSTKNRTWHFGHSGSHLRNQTNSQGGTTRMVLPLLLFVLCYIWGIG